MWKQNSGIKDEDILQNRFTKYLLTAIKRQKVTYLKQKMTQNSKEISLEIQDYQTMFQVEPDMLEKLPLLEKLESRGLQIAIKEMKKQERYVFLARVLEEKSFAELAKELTMGYKGIAAIYYRAVQKICRRIEEVEEE